MNDNAILNATNNIPISLNLACKILHRGKAKVRSLYGTRIRIMKVDNNTSGLNLYDVLSLCGKNI